MAIPKIIHYVWVGTAPIPEQDQKYIEGWQKLNPDFKIKRWSEKDIDLKKYPLVKKALDEKRWALAADIIRMYAVYEDGGFYFAAKNNVPVLPCFITMQDTDLIGADGYPIQEYTIHVSKPIYPDPAKPIRANTQAMLEANYNEWKRIYEEVYGIPLEYTTEK